MDSGFPKLELPASIFVHNSNCMMIRECSLFWVWPVVLESTFFWRRRFQCIFNVAIISSELWKRTKPLIGFPLTQWWSVIWFDEIGPVVLERGIKCKESHSTTTTTTANSQISIRKANLSLQVGWAKIQN